MDLNNGVITLLLILSLIEQGFQAPSPDHRSSSFENDQDDRSSSSKLVEFKLPVKITSMHDLVAWAQNAMRSMASRIDITLESIEEPPKTKIRDDTKKSSKDSRTKPKESTRSKGSPVRTDNRRPVSTSSLVSTYANLLEPENSFDTVIRDNNEISGNLIPRGNVNAYLPLFFDDLEIARYREEALKKYYLDAEQARREKMKQQEKRERIKSKYVESLGQKNGNSGSSNDYDDDEDVSREKINDKKLKPVISVPFEAIVTITRENSGDTIVTSGIRDEKEIRDPPDEFPPYFERNHNYPRRDDGHETVESVTKIKESSQKRQISTLGDLLRMLGFTKKLANSKKSVETNSGRIQTNNSRPRKPAEKFMPPAIQFEDEPFRPRRNETSQRQEFDDDEDEDEEEGGSLGSITDLLPLVIPILEDISDPNTETDLGEVLEAVVPLVQELLQPGEDNPDAPDVLALIGPIVKKIIGGKDGTGSDVGAVLGPVLGLLVPLIGPVLGPIIGPLISTISNPPQSEGSSLASLLTAIIGPLTQPTGHGGMSPLSVLTAGIIAALSKELKPGLPGGLDVGAVVGSVLSGVIAGTSAGLSGSLSSDKDHYQPYGTYGAGPLQAGSVNTGTSTGYVVPASQVFSFQQSGPINQQTSPGNVVGQHGNGNHPTRRPYSTLPQRIPPGPVPRPPPPTFGHPQASGPLTASTTNNGNSGTSYLPYGTTNAVPANSVNPIGLIGNLIKDILGAGVQVGSSVINAVFGILGSSSAEEPSPVYGPAPQPPYNNSPH